MSLISEFTARRMASKMEKYQQEMGERFKDLSPKEAQKAAQEFLKEMQKQQEQKWPQYTG